MQKISNLLFAAIANNLATLVQIQIARAAWYHILKKKKQMR